MTSVAEGASVVPDDPTSRTDGIAVTVESAVTRTRAEEFSAFMLESQPVLWRMAWLLTGDVHRCEDLVQQALVRTYVAWPRARATDPLAYARRTLTNLRIDTWRRHRREVLVAPEHLLPGLEVSSAQRHAERDVLVRALMQLSPRRRRVVVLRYLMDLSEREVADDLDISVGTVKSTASRGLDQLRTLLATTDQPATSSREHS
ncbi:SigE family RNA polymerase sigma factor [Cellulomonas sp. zg-ZUI188]|uniref:SigE family RNA polymerase sigma factor n=1 Tax=Cellulomonas fengjieae TaxID=2819978 RepID=A0ABS3SKF1_9CELL|nr:SigE family RNA polymerase sigma factor [Cellulomonas fengjieae]QVI65965.1 SigE family RNA polymerase sigma factor [Cellulomonas fengjieae]